MGSRKNHYIAIIGGSIAGSEAAFQLAEKGFNIAVFDQMPLPYGKIEDGLPKWHIKLRDKEEEAIDEKLQHPNIRFIPNCRLGRDVKFESLTNDWNFSAIILAIGAWKDRPLGLSGIDAFVNNGLIYQNQLIKWFNHYHESDYKGPQFSIPDNTAVIGGGLSSIDVIKIVQIINVQNALKERGIEEDIFTLEKGIDRVLEKHQLSMQDLGLKGATLFYRKTAKDMPLKPYTEESQREKAREVSEKMLNITMRRYLFNFSGNSVAVGSLIKKDKLNGLIISSIGSLPEQIPGIPSKNDLLKTSTADECRIQGYSNVFAIGNAVTGRGNIKDSRVHGKESASRISDQHLDPKKKQFQDYLRNLESKVDAQIGSISHDIETFPALTSLEIDVINANISILQEKVGYSEDYFSWKEKHLWERLEDDKIKVEK